MDSSRKGVKFKAVVFMICALSALFFYFSSQRSDAQSQASVSEKPVLTQALFSKGETLYQKQCASCHGVFGAGDGKAAYLLYPKPRDFTRGEFRLISTTDMSVTDEDLFKTITRGMPGSAMPPWEFLSEKDRWALVYYVRYLSELGQKKAHGQITDEALKDGLSWEEEKGLASIKIDPESMIKIPNEPKRTPGSVARGRELFIKGCASCHGQQGRGDGQQLMMDSLGFPIKPRDLTSGIFKGSSSSEDLYYRMAAGLPGSPMPSYNGAFTEEQIWDLIHYVQTLPKQGAEEQARLHRHTIKARKGVRVLLDPSSEEWARIEPVFISLTPLWWRNNRIESVGVKAMHDGNQIAIQLSWADPKKDASVVTPQSFSDGAAIQISSEKDPPFFGMGSAAGPVTIWNWKAAWQEDLKSQSNIDTHYPNAAIDWYESQRTYQHGSQFEASESKASFHDPLFLTAWGAGNFLADPERKSAAEEAQAKGFGTLTTTQPLLEQVDAEGVWSDGRWTVVFHRALRSSDKGQIRLKPGAGVSIAFAVWDGAEGDRNGQKMVSIWNELVLEK